MNENELTDGIVQELNCNHSDAERVSSKVAEYVRDREESELTERMRDPDYIPAVLRENTAPGDIISRWNR